LGEQEVGNEPERSDYLHAGKEEMEEFRVLYQSRSLLLETLH